jgi:hypothetical protein
MKESEGCFIQIVVITIFGSFAYYKFKSIEKEADLNLKKQMEIIQIEKSKEERFKNTYNFNVVTSFNFPIKKVLSNNNYLKIKKPLIVYFRENNLNKFSYRLTSKFSKTKYDFIYDSIKTIVILERKAIVHGNYYSYFELKTKAIQEELNIYFFESKSRKILKKLNKKGGLPPKEIKFRKGQEPKFSLGERIKEKNIVDFINNSLN